MKYREWLLSLYPQAWRKRYGDEFQALLEQRGIRFFDLFDILRGALDAHLHPQLTSTGTVSERWIQFMVQRMRRSIILMFCAYTSRMARYRDSDGYLDNHCYQRAHSRTAGAHGIASAVAKSCQVGTSSSLATICLYISQAPLFRRGGGWVDDGRGRLRRPSLPIDNATGRLGRSKKHR